MLHIHVNNLLILKEDALVFSLQLSFFLLAHAVFSVKLLLDFDCV